jgi:hypothetical protein
VLDVLEATVVVVLIVDVVELPPAVVVVVEPPLTVVVVEPPLTVVVVEPPLTVVVVDGIVGPTTVVVVVGTEAPPQIVGRVVEPEAASEAASWKHVVSNLTALFGIEGMEVPWGTNATVIIDPFWNLWSSGCFVTIVPLGEANDGQTSTCSLPGLPLQRSPFL